MNDKILTLIIEYGLEAVVLALGINVLTGLIKLPIKAGAKKMADGSKLTRYLVFLPVALGLLLTSVYMWVVNDTVHINRAFVTLWTTSSSLSMTFYAFWEKLFPTKEKILKDYEIEANEKLLSEIKILAGLTPADTIKYSEEKINSNTENEVVTGNITIKDVGKKKIILKGRKGNEKETETEKQSA